ncbi:MAG: ribonuclease P protein component [Candidatus Izemoplasmatales bacterium]|mgnify:CR=1 FL=1
MKKKFRIKKNEEIQQLLKEKNTVGNNYFVIYHKKDHEAKNFRFAIAVSKKYGKAHERNLMKRRIREVVKLNYFKENVEFFIIAKLKSKPLNFEKIKVNLEELFKQAQLLKER